MEFDRLILLQDGYQLFQGPTADIAPYLKSLNVQFGKFSNIADLIIKMAQAPNQMREGLTLEELKSNYEK